MYGRRNKRRHARRSLALTSLVALFLLGTGASAAQAALTAVGPLDPNTDFPTYFQDSQNTRLALCLDPTGGLCLTSVPGTPSVPDNFPADGEAFWFNASASLDSGAISGILVQAVEAAFANGDVVDGEQIGFARIRIRFRGLTRNSTYTVTYPYGRQVLTSDAAGAINVTSDVGCFDTPNCDFSRVLNGAVGPFLRWDPAVGPAAPAGYIGDPNVDHRVIGSPNATNFFRIEGPGLPGGVLTTDLFSVQGKIAPNAPPPPPPAPTAVFTPANVDFGSVQVGQTSATRTVQVSNGGNAPLNISNVALVNAGANFNIVSNTCTAPVAAGGSCAVGVTFSPQASGGFSAQLRFTDNAGTGTQNVGLSGVGTAAPGPGAVVSPTTVQFPATQVNTTSPAQQVTLTNNGNAPLTITSVAVLPTGSDFAISNNACGSSLAAQASCTVSVTFTPTAAAARSATLRFTDNAPSGTQDVTLNGTGTQAPPPPAPGAVVSPTTVQFPATQVNTTSPAQQVTLTNNGNAPLTITSVAVLPTGSDFAISNNACGSSLAAQASCTVSVTFTPTAAAARSATLRFTDNAPSGTQDVTLNGTGTAAPPPPAPNASVSPTSIAFPATVLGDATTPRSVTLTNSGNAPLTVSDVSIAGADPNYTVSSNSCTTGPVAANGGTCQVTVVFNPQSVGAHPATLRFTDNAASGTQDVALTGTGLPIPPPPPPQNGQPGLGVNPTFLDFGNQSVLLSILLPPSRRPLTVTNTGDAPLTINGLSVSGPQGSDFTIESTDCSGATLAPGATCTINMAFRAGLLGLGSRNGVLTIASNAPAPGGLRSVPLFGNGTVL